jgi:hypothetical protein
MWQLDLDVSRAMAQTHIYQDLRQSLMDHGVGLDKDWKCVGKEVLSCEKQYYNWAEVSGSQALGTIGADFDPGKLRDKVRDEVKTWYAGQ